MNDPMIITVFRSRLNPETEKEYTKWAGQMSMLAEKMPGYISHKGFTAEDGERVNVVEFDSEKNHRAWATHPEHIKAQKLGRQSFYLSYDIKVCKVIRSNRYPKTDFN